MANIKLEHVTKVYSNGVKAVDDFNMDINDREFIVFVGPSGCGKSTTLRMIAGLEEITEGTVSIDGVVVNNTEPKNRNIAMVFQNYALYPHMSVYDNMAFGLKIRKKAVAVREENGEPVLTVDKNTIIKDKQRLYDLKNTLLIYQKNKDTANVERITNIIEEIKKTVENDRAKLAADKETYKKYSASRKIWLRLLKKSDATEDEKANAKAEVDSNKQGLVQLYKFVHYTKEEIDIRVKEAAKILGITDYLRRKPKAMSGGQRQRVALGRCIVREPKVFLLDEPLSNLDAKLRASMRVEISKLHDKLKTTFIYVTHDQIEAMTMGTRIVVMKSGVIQQIDSPTNLYSNPCNKFVAGFIGTPQMNFYKGSITKADGKIRVRFDDTDVDVLMDGKYFESIPEEYLIGEKMVIFGIRSEHLTVENIDSPLTAKAKVSYVEELGEYSQIYVDFNLNAADNIDESETKGIIKAQPKCPYKNGDIINVSFKTDNLFVFDAENEKNINL